MTAQPSAEGLPLIDLDPHMRMMLRAVFRTPGWTVTTGTRFSGGAYLRLESAPRGRGHQRDRYVLMADTLADAFRALAAVLIVMRVSHDQPTKGEPQ